MTDGPRPEIVELAHQMFDLAREGRADQLLAYVDAALVAAGADLDAGTPTARETATMFGRSL